MKRMLAIAALTAFGTLPLLSPSAAQAADYAHQVQAKKMSFAWTVNGDKLDVKLTAETTGWVAIGFNPTDAMKGANYILGYVKDGKVTLSDDFGDTPTGHKPDDKLGGTEDVAVIGGSEENGATTIEFSIPLASADANDGTITVDGDTVVLLAYGPDRDSFKVKHKYRTAMEVNLGTGVAAEL
jgi:hypothetical protein